ncbi:hypothetical protein HanHA300_Chr00c0710g0806051 [Helianthus annuus]|nr:hypothetical protein HanHA300_Chr00c0710g0806051 [Helianthus annuus]
MILKSFLLGNLVSLCMKIINSVVVVGLYYGFLTTFSIGPSYLFLLRAHVMEEGEEGAEKKVSATTGFITGQLIMFISIYYAPLHLALGRPHTITVLALPYLLFHFFCNSKKNFLDYGSTTRNSMRNLSIQCVFLNNLIFQLLNHFILPSSMLARLVNIFMFRCNSKMLFVTSSFVGWIIGHILFMKWVGLLLVWIRQNRSIRKYIQANKYLVLELKNSMSMAGIFSIFLLVTCVHYLGRIPSPIFSTKLNMLEKMEEEEEFDNNEEEEFDNNEEEEFDNNKTVDYMYGNQENLKFKILEKKQKDEEKNFFLFEKPILTFFFDYNRWNRPLRYIRKINKKLKGSVRKEASQYFFYTCQSDGKQRISFTYPPSLSTFGEMIARRISLSTLEKISPDELYTEWVFTNKEKTEEEMKHRIDRRNTIRNQIEIMKKNKKTVTLKKKINKKNNGEALPTIWKILKRNNIELIVKIFIEKIYIDIFLCIINMRRIALQLFMESTKKIIEKYIDNNETNKEKINKTKQNQIDFISTRTIKKAFDNLRNSKRKSNIFFELSYLSQKYVFLKLSQTQVIHFNKLRSILQYNGPSFFLKNEIKDFFGRQGIFDYEVRHKKLPNSGMNPWKNWLRGHYQYDLSQITWSRLVPQKWRNGKNQCQPSQNKDLNKWYSYEKDQLFDYKKKQNLKVYLLSNKEENFQKNYRYDRLSYKYIHSETNKKSYIYRSSLEPNKKQENSTRNKEKTVNILKNIPIKNYLGKSDIIYMEKKYR